MRKLRMLSLCSGIGGADLAAEWTGQIEIVGQVEINPFCQRVLAAHWPLVKRAGDIRKVQGDEFGTIDIIVGGIPCQPFSSAGKQRGQEDDRYLWPEMLRLVTRAHPAWVVIENVDDFTYLALDNVSADLESQGYTVQAFVLPACSVGAPHLRQRCFVVAHADRYRDIRQESDLTSGQRGAALSASVCQWTNPARMWGLHEERAGSTLLCGNTATGDEPQPRMGRVPDGISTRMDGHRWPALPGEAQEEWEPARTVTGRQRYRNQRLKAIGNAIVPLQIFPIFAGIVEWEQR